jgi:hypothetical protein
VEYNRNLSESLAVVGKINPSSQAAGELLTGAINTNLHRRVLFIVALGTPGSSGTLDAVVKASSTSGGSYTAVPNSATNITQLAAAGVALIEVKAESLAAAGIGPYIKGSMTVGTATSPTAMIALGSCDRYEPASDNNISGTATPVVF